MAHHTRNSAPNGTGAVEVLAEIAYRGDTPHAIPPPPPAGRPRSAS